MSIAATSTRICAPANTVLLVRPRNFSYNVQTAASNALQNAGAPAAAASAHDDFEALRSALAARGVQVIALDEPSSSHSPDAVFPNNWVSFHADGTLFTYPMLAENRRSERSEALIAAACERAGFAMRRRIDWSAHERAGMFLEGTGSLVIDHAQRTAYAARSPRTGEALVREWGRVMDHEAVLFDSRDERGQPYYHTNVLLWIGARVAALCAEALPPEQRAAVCARLRAGGRHLLELSRAQVRQFAGNMLELTVRDGAAAGQRLLLMSEQAQRALSSEQRVLLDSAVDQIVAVGVPTIEAVGGGSVRCMVAEVPC